jgi:hypothetical protein
MPESSRKRRRKGKFLPLTMKRIRHARKVPRSPRVLLSFLGFVLLLPLVISAGCAPSSSPGDGKQNSSASESGDLLPEITDELIREQINDTRVRGVPEENGAAEPINWNFSQQDPEEIAVVEKRIEGARATIVLEIKTQSAPKAREQRSLAGQIRTEWLLKTGWALRRWELVKTENISMKYKNLPKPPAPNSNR